MMRLRTFKKNLMRSDFRMKMLAWTCLLWVGESDSVQEISVLAGELSFSLGEGEDLFTILWTLINCNPWFITFLESVTQFNLLHRLKNEIQKLNFWLSLTSLKDHCWIFAWLLLCIMQYMESEWISSRKSIMIIPWPDFRGGGVNWESKIPFFSQRWKLWWKIRRDFQFKLMKLGWKKLRLFRMRTYSLAQLNLN